MKNSFIGSCKRWIFSSVLATCGFYSASSQSLTVKEIENTSFSGSQNEKQFSDIVKQKAEASSSSKSDAVNASYGTNDLILQKNLHLSFPMISGFDTTKAYAVRLNIGLTNGGKECFSDSFVLDKNTGTNIGAAFYISANNLNFDITTRAVKGEYLYCTILVTDKNGIVQTISGQYKPN